MMKTVQRLESASRFDPSVPGYSILKVHSIKSSNVNTWGRQRSIRPNWDLFLRLQFISLSRRISTPKWTLRINRGL